MSVEKSQNPSVAGLEKQQYIRLKTFRKSGAAVATIVWFVLASDKLYVTTTKNAGKIKRIRNNGRVLFVASDGRGNVHGNEVAGQARILPESDFAYADETLARKYKFLYKVFMFVGRLRKTERTYIEITPSE